MRFSWFALLIMGLGLACGDPSGAGIRLDVSPDSIQMNRSDTVRLSVTALDANGSPVTGLAVTFESSDTTVASVTSAGLVRGGSAVGRTTIRVTGGGAETTVPVRVSPVPSGIVMAPSDTVIRISLNVQFHAWVVDEVGDSIPGIVLHWHSSDTALATVTQAGLVTTRTRAGFLTITTDFGSVLGASAVQVAIPGRATRVDLAPADTVIPVGDSAQLRATAYDAFGTGLPSSELIWISDASHVVTISSTGLARSVNGYKGRVMIRAVVDTGSALVESRAFVSVTDTIIVARSSAGGGYGAAISVGNVAYVTNTSGSTILRANLPTTTFGQSVTVGSTPLHVVFNSTGSRAYVANNASSTVSVIDVGANAQIDLIPVGAQPYEVIVAPGDSILWVGKTDSLYAMRLATKQVVSRFSIGGVANGMAIARDTLLYVSTQSPGTVLEFDLRSRTLGRTFTVGGAPQKIALSADGSELYIANGYLQFWDLDTGLQIDSLVLPAAPYGLALRPSNGLLYATSPSFGAGYVYIIDPTTRTLVYSTTVGGSTREVAFNADGSIGIIPNEAGWVDFIK